MEGFPQAYTVLTALSGAVVAWVILLWAYRRIPQQPAPESLHELRADILALAEQFQEFVETHDRSMGRYYAQVGHLRRKLRRVQEEEGDLDDFAEPGGEAPPQAQVGLTPALLPTRDQQKAVARAHLRAVEAQKGRV